MVQTCFVLQTLKSKRNWTGFVFGGGHLDEAHPMRPIRRGFDELDVIEFLWFFDQILHPPSRRLSQEELPHSVAEVNSNKKTSN